MIVKKWNAGKGGNMNPHIVRSMDPHNVWIHWFGLPLEHTLLGHQDAPRSNPIQSGHVLGKPSLSQFWVARVEIESKMDVNGTVAIAQDNSMLS